MKSANETPSHGEEQPITLHEYVHVMELSAADPDRVLTNRQQSVLRRTAVAGALTGLEWGAPVAPSRDGHMSGGALELASQWA